MCINLWTNADIRNRTLAQVVLVVRGAQHQGYDPAFIAGAFALAEAQVTAVGIEWRPFVADVKAQVGAPLSQLVDAALRREIEG